MPDEELTHWGRGDRVLQAYEKINADPRHGLRHRQKQ
jgi:hypothetical protein